MSLSSANSVTCVTTWDTHPQCYLRRTGNCPRQGGPGKDHTIKSSVNCTPNFLPFPSFLLKWVDFQHYMSVRNGIPIWRVSCTQSSRSWNIPEASGKEDDTSLPLPKSNLKVPSWRSSQMVEQHEDSTETLQQHRSHARPWEPGKRPKHSSLWVILMGLVAILEALGNQWNTSYQSGDWSQSPTFKRTFYPS